MEDQNSEIKIPVVGLRSHTLHNNEKFTIQKVQREEMVFKM